VIDPTFTTDRMRAIFAPASFVQRMLDFEAALARAEAAVGVIPRQAAGAIAVACRGEPYDADALAMAARAAGNKAIPLVAALTERVDPSARGFVHWGATSQDVLDTALVLQMRDALGLLDTECARLADALARQAAAHKLTPLPGRTWLQQALPITLGQKLAATLSAVQRHRTRIAELVPRVRVLQFGGAAGTLASLGAQALAVESALAAELELAVADIPWHTQRDGVCEAAAVLGGIVATAGKLARDISLLAQTEVAEAFEPAAPGKGGSSTLPHKRNPVGCAVALAAAVRAPNLVATMLAAAVQEHERGLGNWPAEWDTLPDLFELAAGAVATMQAVIDGLDVDIARMRSNLDATHGQIMAEAVQMALATHIGRDKAHKLVAGLCRQAAAEKLALKAVLVRDATVASTFDAAVLDALLDPVNYLGSSAVFVERVLARHAAR
jgi:3-carboxy-cis,cis-muconate cycloisomerase